MGTSPSTFSRELKFKNPNFVIYSILIWSISLNSLSKISIQFYLKRLQIYIHDISMYIQIWKSNLRKMVIVIFQNKNLVLFIFILTILNSVLILCYLIYVFICIYMLPLCYLNFELNVNQRLYLNILEYKWRIFFKIFKCDH